MEELRQQDFGFKFPAHLEAALKRSQNYLFSIQKPEGYWVGELMVDSTLVSDMIAFHHWDGSVDRKWERKAINHIFSMQLADGGWNIYHGGPSEVNATIKAYLALKLAGVPATDHRMLRARELAMNFGGIPRMNTFSKLYLALLGLFPWEYVPTIPPEVLLIGKWFHVNFWDMSNWSRAMLVPLAIINHHKPTHPPANNVNLDELYPQGFHERDLAMPPDPDKVSLRNFFLWLDRLHKLAEWFAEHNVHPFRKRALRKCEQWMLERFEGSDGLAAIFPAMLNSVIALKALGYERDNPILQREMAQLKRLQHETENSVRVEPCFSPVWDTAIVNIHRGAERTSIAVGGPAGDDTVYVKDVSRPDVFTVQKTAADDLSKTADDYRRKEMFDMRAFTATRIEITRGGKTTAFDKVKGTGENAQDTWKRVSPTPAEPDKEKFQTFVAALADIRAMSFVDAKARTGLDSPAATIVVKFDEGKKEDRVLLGKGGADAFASRPDDPGAAKIDPTKLDDALKSIDEFAK